MPQPCGESVLSLYTHLENFMSRPNVILAFQPTPLHKQGQELRSGQTATHLHEQRKPLHNYALDFLSSHIRNNSRNSLLSVAVEGKNRPVATNFQFLKMLRSTGTSLLQCVCISEVILLGRACPKPCSCSHLAVRKNGVSCLHSFIEKLARRQEVQ